MSRPSSSVTTTKVGHIHAPRSRQRTRAGQKRSSRSTAPQSSLRSVAELWVAQLGTVPYGEACRAAGDASRAAPGRRESRTCCSCSSTRPCTRRAGAPSPPTSRWARTGTAPQGIEVCDTDRGGRVTYHGPGQLVAYPIMAVERVADFVHTMEGAIVAALADEGIAAEVRETPLTGVWAGDAKIASIGVRVSGGVTTHGLAVNVDNDLQPFEWIVPCGIDHVRMTSVAKRDRAATARCPASASAWRGALPRRSACGSGSCRRGGSPSGRSWRREHALALEPGRRSGARHGRGAPVPRAQAGLVQAPGPRRARLPRAARDDRGPGPPHGLPGGRLPEHRRVLGARHGHLHDPRRHLHAPLRVLQRQDGQAHPQRPARAAARGAVGEARWAFATR